VTGLTTTEILQIALRLSGLTEIPPDSGVHVPGDNLRRILFAMDVNVGLLHLARQQGFDVVMGHHPCGALLRQGEVFRRHLDLLALHGVPRWAAEEALAGPIEAAVRRSANKRFRMLPYEAPNNTVLEVDVARMLSLPFLNVHNPLDEAGRRLLQARIDAGSAADPSWTLGDLLALIRALPEARQAEQAYGISPVIHLGQPGGPAGKTVFVHGALSAPSAPIVRFYWRHGVQTVVMLHGDFDTLEALRAEPGGSLVLTGHYLGDSLGMTPFIRALRARGAEVVCVGGIIDTGEAGG
jgi:hypothetical protein